MRDAFGGVFTTNLLLVFIFIFVAVTAVSLNYAKAFRLKNSVIDFVEKNEITDVTKIDAKIAKLDKIISSSNYNKECSAIRYDGKFLSEGIVKSPEGKNIGYCHGGVLFLKDREEKISGTSAKIIYYQVKTYADWELGALNKILALAGEGPDSVLQGSWTVTGEAKVVYKN